MLAVIPARGGSKGLPGKNVASFAGHPLISWTIDCALRCGLFERVVVSTDSPEIERVSKIYGAETVRRPAELATDTASPKDAVVHVCRTLEEVDYRPRYLALLQPTSPLRTVSDIHSCVDLVTKGGFDTAATYSMAIPHPARAYVIKEDGTAEPVLSADDVWLPRQAREPQYHLNGAVYVVEVDRFLADKSKQFLLARIGAHIMAPEQSIDIDTEAELKLAELLLDERQAPKPVG